jgi:DNA-binding transcriptional MerR regulator
MHRCRGQRGVLHIVGIGAVSQLIGRSPDTLRRWEKDGLVLPGRDRYGRRRYSAEDVERCRELARLSPQAQRCSTKLIAVLSGQPRQLTLFEGIES